MYACDMYMYICIYTYIHIYIYIYIYYVFMRIRTGSLNKEWLTSHRKAQDQTQAQLFTALGFKFRGLLCRV